MNLPNLYRKLSMLLILSLTLSMLALPSLAAALGTQTASETRQVTTGGTALTSTSHQQGSYSQKENVVTYTPGSDVRPVVAYGTTLYGRSTLDYVGNYLNGIGQTPAAGINGSFFDMSNGLPYGCVITDGIVRTSGNIETVGFYEDGRAIIGTPGLSISVSYPSGGRSTVLYNKQQATGNGIILYSQDYDLSTKGTMEQFYVVLRPQTDELTLGANISATVESIVTCKSLDIPDGCFVLAEATDTIYTSTLAQLKALKVGDTLQIAVSCDQNWLQVQYACGAGDMLVSGGVAAKTFSLDSANERAARSALGIKADGSVVLYTIDGRQSGYSQGVTLPELAARMVELGCITAVNLDGGGSTTMAVRKDGTLQTVNRPSDGAQRRCANFIFLVYDVGSISASDPQQTLLPGAQIPLTVTTRSRNGIVVPNPANLQYKAASGSVTDGVYTAGTQSGSDTVTIRWGDLQDTCTVWIQEPTAMQIVRADTGAVMNDSSFTLKGGQSLDLNASASVAGNALYGQDTCFTWHVEGEIGDIDKNGLFTAALSTQTLTGSITVQCGKLSTRIGVTVEPGLEEVRVVAGFEPGDTLPQGGEQITFTQNLDRSYIRYGSGSLALHYDLTGAEQVIGSCEIQLDDSARQLGFWVWSDNSRNQLYVRVKQGSAVQPLAAGALAGNGWQYCSVALPAGEKTVAGFAVAVLGEDAATSGTIYLDQLLVSHSEVMDTEPPVLQAEFAQSTLRVTLTDSLPLSAEHLQIFCDGQPLSFNWDDNVATAQLPQDGKQHKLMLYASDPAGNLASLPLTVSGELENPFADTQEHWARAPIAYLNKQGVLSGSTDSSGALLYRPGDPMTRQEFVVATMRALGVDLSAYQDVELPFDDTEDIAAWALDACKAAWSLGYLGGSSSGELLLCNPKANITRHEAISILGRKLDLGYAQADLSVFTDAQDVADWARLDVAVMVARGVISGNNGRLLPREPVTRAEVAQILYQLY